MLAMEGSVSKQIYSLLQESSQSLGPGGVPGLSSLLLPFLLGWALKHPQMTKGTCYGMALESDLRLWPHAQTSKSLDGGT